MDVEVQVKGLQALEARLLELDALGGEKLIRRVLRKVAAPMAAEARENAALIGRSGALYKSIAIYNRRPKGAQVARVAVGSRAGNKIAVRMHNNFYGRKRKGVFYGWMVDQGHRIGTSKTGALTKATTAAGSLRAYQRGKSFGAGRTRAEPWFTYAVRATEPRAVAGFLGELRKAVARLEKRTGKTPNPDSLVPE